MYKSFTKLLLNDDLLGEISVWERRHSLSIKFLQSALRQKKDRELAVFYLICRFLESRVHFKFQSIEFGFISANSSDTNVSCLAGTIEEYNIRMIPKFIT